MSEIAQRELERRLPLFEVLKRHKIIDRESLRKLIRQYTSICYQYAKRHKRSVDYLRMIRFEMQFLNLIRSVDKEKQFRCRWVIIRTISSIERLFRQATLGGRCKSDTRLWMSYIKFCKDELDPESASRVYSSMIRLCASRNENVWAQLADWEAKNFEPFRARAIYQRALRFLPKSQMIWLQYFTFEHSQADNDDVAFCIFEHGVKDAQIDPARFMASRGISEALKLRIADYVRIADDDNTQWTEMKKTPRNDLVMMDPVMLELEQLKCSRIDHEEKRRKIEAIVDTVGLKNPQLTRSAKLLLLQFYIDNPVAAETDGAILAAKKSTIPDDDSSSDEEDAGKDVAIGSTPSLAEYYRYLTERPPYGIDLLLCFVQACTDPACVRRAFERMAGQIGSADVSVWVEWVKFEMRCSWVGKARMGNVQTVYRRALNSLGKGEQVIEFSEQFAELTSSSNGQQHYTNIC